MKFCDLNILPLKLKSAFRKICFDDTMISTHINSMVSCDHQSGGGG